MWYKYLIFFLLFYFFAILQNSFFAHFALFGSAPNLVFIFFFFLVFFSDKNNYSQILALAIFAGFFLDIFSSIYFGTLIAVLLLIAFSCKKIQGLLKEKKGSEFPFIYFLPLFLAMFLFYLFVAGSFSFSDGFIAEIIYNIIFSSIIFYIYKKFFFANFNNRQLMLFSQ